MHLGMIASEYSMNIVGKVVRVFARVNTISVYIIGHNNQKIGNDQKFIQSYSVFGPSIETKRERRIYNTELNGLRKS